MKKQIKQNSHQWQYSQNGGLIQVQISTIDDVFNLKNLDPKQWTALSCPVKGLEFNEETLQILDSDKNGRVRVPEILEAIEYIKKYFKRPEVIMNPGDTIPLAALGEEPFPCGHSPLDSAKAVLDILKKEEAFEISLDDININDKLFSPGVINGDGVLPPECVKEDEIAAVVKDIIECTGGTDDISGVKGINREQFEEFFALIRSIKEWRETAVNDDPKIFFLKEQTDSAATSFMKLRDKINDYYLRCSLINYDSAAQEILKTQTDAMFLDENGELQDMEHLAKLPLARCNANEPLPLTYNINPAWAKELEEFNKNVIIPVYNKEIGSLTENHWRKIEALFEPYVNWIKAMPQNAASGIGLDRIVEILSSDVEAKISEYLTLEEAHPPIALATVDLKKMLLLRRDFITLLHNYVNFDDLYRLDKAAIFQAGTLFIDGRSCDLCFRVLDSNKHGVMAALSQCFLVYCDCTKSGTGEKMQIAALISNGSTDNLIVGRNGIFYDRNGDDWDATIVKIIDNPVSIKQAFWSPYKKLMRMIQEKIASKASAAEGKVLDNMNKAVENPKETGANAAKEKFNVGSIAAISIAITGIASLISQIVKALFGLKLMLPVGILGLMLLISLPSVIIAWRKLRQRNIGPILDASGWAINGTVKITTALGSSLTSLPKRPMTAYLSKNDAYAEKKFPIKRVIFAVVLIAIIAGVVILFWKKPELWGKTVDYVKSCLSKSKEAVGN